MSKTTRLPGGSTLCGLQGSSHALIGGTITESLCGFGVLHRVSPGTSKPRRRWSCSEPKQNECVTVNEQTREPLEFMEAVLEHTRPTVLGSRDSVCEMPPLEPTSLDLFVNEDMAERTYSSR